MEWLFLAWTLWMTQHEKKEGENSGCVGIIFPLASGKWENMRKVIRGKRAKKTSISAAGGRKRLNCWIQSGSRGRRFGSHQKWPRKWNGKNGGKLELLRETILTSTRTKCPYGGRIYSIFNVNFSVNWVFGYAGHLWRSITFKRILKGLPLRYLQAISQGPSLFLGSVDNGIWERKGWIDRND